MPNSHLKSNRPVSNALPLAHALMSGTVHRRWATASLNGAPDTQPGELDELGVHVEDCRDASGRWFTARVMAESAIGFIAPRLVTTAVLVAIVFGVVSLIA